MVASNREKYILFGLLGLLLLWAADSYIVGPYWDARNKLITDRLAIEDKLNNAQALYRAEDDKRAIWNLIQARGLESDAARAETQELTALNTWARWSSATLVQYRPDRQTQQDRFLVIGYSMTTTGTLYQISNLLWALESSMIPMRVAELQITPRQEGSNDLQARISVSALCLAPPGSTAPKAAAGSPLASATGGQ